MPNICSKYQYAQNQMILNNKIHAFHISCLCSLLTSLLNITETVSVGIGNKYFSNIYNYM